MVFIEERHKYLNEIQSRPKLYALSCLLWGNPINTIQEELNEIDEIYINCIQAIEADSIELFKKQYELISKRKVVENSSAPFVHDDFLIFVLIVGVVKFEQNMNWLINLVHLKVKNKTTNTFENLLTKNYQSKTNNQSIVLTFLFIINKSNITNDLLKDSYQDIIDLNQTFTDEFLKICHYRAFDLIFQYKIPRDSDQIARLILFEDRFKKRITVFSYISYHLILIVLLVFSYWILQKLPAEWKSNINDVGILIGIAGVGLIGNLLPKLKKNFRDLNLSLFGYKGEDNYKSNKNIEG